MSTIDLDDYECADKGTILPIINEYTWSKGFRIAIYLLGMVWCFLGIAIVADMFMLGIEKITSKTRIIRVSNPKSKGGYDQIEVKVWNDTVANLSLMAFGTSAPEILLSVIGIVTKGFKSEELGPATIVGSAAFNLLVITAVCIAGIPNGETRKIENIRVYLVTTFFSMFAYTWMIIVLVAISPDVVDIWEAVVTFLMFPALIVVSFFVDKMYCCRRQNKTSSEIEIGIDIDNNVGGKASSAGGDESVDIIHLAKELGKHKIPEEEAAKIAAAKLSQQQSHNRGWYRIQATRNLTGGHRLIPAVKDTFQDLYKQIQVKAPTSDSTSLTGVDMSENGSKAVVEFTSAFCAVMENKGKVTLGVKRYGKVNVPVTVGKVVVKFALAFCAVMENKGKVTLGVKRYDKVNVPVTVGIETIDGTAEAGSDYIPLKTKLKFGANDCRKDISIEIIDDDVYEDDEIFFAKLFIDHTDDGAHDIVLGHTSINQITIINDDEPGCLEFSKPSYVISEGNGRASLVVNRVNGADGTIRVNWVTKDMSATSGREYNGGQGTIEFAHAETQKNIEIPVIDNEIENKDVSFMVELTNPTGGAKIGKMGKTIVTLVDDDEFNGMVSRIVAQTQQNLDSLKLESSSWREQFYNAMNVNGGDVENATNLDYVMHFLSFFWKVLFAFIPPPSYGGGWLTFIFSLLMIGLLTAIVGDMASIFGCLVGLNVLFAFIPPPSYGGGWLTFIFSLLMIGLLTAIVGDMASIFGCLVGLNDLIAAITFVALGTSMPDTFASRQAALQERTADSSVGNINGSNAVNVFLGLGLPWLIASIYWGAKGTRFDAPRGSLVFSVILYLSTAVMASIILLVRRRCPGLFGGAELGGKTVGKWISAAIFVTLWIIYVVMSSLQSVDVISVGV